MKKEYRIKKQKEIDLVFKTKKSVGDSFFVLYKQEDNSLGHFLFAISIGKKYGNSVSRNRCKRRVREVIRKYKEVIKKNQKIIIVCKPFGNELSFQMIFDSLAVLLKKAKVLEETNEKV